MMSPPVMMPAPRPTYVQPPLAAQAYNSAVPPPVRSEAPAPPPRQVQAAAPVVRGQAPDEPAPRKNPVKETTSFDIPSPEELGLAAPRSQPSQDLDWDQVHNRLTQLGAVCSQRLQLQDGGY